MERTNIAPRPFLTDSTVALMLQCCVCRRLSVTLSIVTKRCVPEHIVTIESLLAVVYEKSNDLDLCLEVV